MRIIQPVILLVNVIKLLLRVALFVILLTMLHDVHCQHERPLGKFKKLKSARVGVAGGVSYSFSSIADICQNST